VPQVRIAQQNGDHVCLAHALALLCQVLGDTTPTTITALSRAPGASPAARHQAQLAQLLRRCLRWATGRVFSCHDSRACILSLTCTLAAF
jgi:hypothetical protein